MIYYLIGSISRYILLYLVSLGGALSILPSHNRKHLQFKRKQSVSTTSIFNEVMAGAAHATVDVARCALLISV